MKEQEYYQLYRKKTLEAGFTPIGRKRFAGIIKTISLIPETIDYLAKKTMEFTGDYQKCNSCGYVWDFNETHCPECGSQDFEDINANEVRQHYKNVKGDEYKRMIEMLKSHGN